jgi:hypothetical protein
MDTFDEVEIENQGDLPPRLPGPASIEPLDLYINGHQSPFETAKAANLTELAPQLAVGALLERGGADQFAYDAFL